MPAARNFVPRLASIERLSYVLLALPFLTDYIERGRWPRGPREWVSETAAVLMILLFIWTLRGAGRELERLEAARKDLMQALVHDMKSPMAAVQVALSAVLSKSVPERHRDEVLGTALDGCRRTVDLIESLLDLEQLEVGRMPMHKRSLPIPPLLEAVVRESAPLAARAGVRLETDPRMGPAFIEADEELLHRVLHNLVQNSLKYTPADGVVTLRGRVAQDGTALFEVADTGPGIPAPYRGKVFERYFRVEGKDQSRHRGTGLGLYFCRLAVEAHGGRIQVADGPEPGCRIEFSIPQREGT